MMTLEKRGKKKIQPSGRSMLSSTKLSSTNAIGVCANGKVSAQAAFRRLRGKVRWEGDLDASRMGRIAP
jgi:hypothetical protein